MVTGEKVQVGAGDRAPREIGCRIRASPNRVREFRQIGDLLDQLDRFLLHQSEEFLAVTIDLDRNVRLNGTCAGFSDLERRRALVIGQAVAPRAPLLPCSDSLGQGGSAIPSQGVDSR